MEWFAAICCCFRVQLLYKHKSLIELESQEGFDLSLFSAFHFSKVFAYGLTFSMLSTRKETVQIYWQKN
jgi:lipoprotein signal peptidase